MAKEGAPRHELESQVTPGGPAPHDSKHKYKNKANYDCI